jgi:hypothetical protein
LLLLLFNLFLSTQVSGTDPQQKAFKLKVKLLTFFDRLNRLTGKRRRRSEGVSERSCGLGRDMNHLKELSAKRTASRLTKCCTSTVYVIGVKPYDNLLALLIQR